jgi:hypothetical protein
MGMMALPFSISVMCVVFGRTANLDSERGRTAGIVLDFGSPD